MNHDPLKISCFVFSLQANCLENSCVISPHVMDIKMVNPRAQGKGEKEVICLRSLLFGSSSPWLIATSFTKAVSVKLKGKEK